MDSNFKAIYQQYEWCYQKFIVEGLNHAEMALEAGTTVRTIKKWCVEKHRLKGNTRRKIKTFSDKQRSLIVGSLLGDGHITNQKYKPLFIVSHAEDEKEYLYWKYNLLIDFCNKPPRFIDSMDKPFGDKVYKSQPAYRFNTRVCDSLIEFRDMSIVDLANSLDRFSLSVWMLDDGSRADNQWYVCVAPYESNEIEYIVKILNEQFQLDCKRSTSDDRYVKFTADSSRKLDGIIMNEFPNELDIIRKKILNKNIREKANYFWIHYNNEKIGLHRFCLNHKLPYKLARIFYHEGINDGQLLIDAVKGCG